MKPTFKRILLIVFKILWGIILLGKILNWFLNFNDQTNEILNTAMFCGIGIFYLAAAWAFERLLIKIIIALCGAYLIIMNFLPEFPWKSIIGIIGIVVPMVFGNFISEEKENHENKLQEKEFKI
ncbi:MAG: hypothetical protein ACPGRE_05005 [Flavobacteriaceae bacterium]